MTTPTTATTYTHALAQPIIFFQLGYKWISNSSCWWESVSWIIKDILTAIEKRASVVAQEILTLQRFVSDISVTWWMPFRFKARLIIGSDTNSIRSGEEKRVLPSYKSWTQWLVSAIREYILVEPRVHTFDNYSASDTLE